MSTQTKGWKIRSKLLAMVMLLVLVSIGVGAVAYYGFTQANNSLNEMHQNLVPELTKVDEIAHNVAKARRYEKEFFLFSSLGKSEVIVKKQQGYFKELTQTYGLVAKTIESERLNTG